MATQSRDFHGRNIYVGAPRPSCGEQFCRKCCLIFLTVAFLLVGFIVLMIGLFDKPFWGPESDWCSFCKESRLQTERNLANCRIVGPIFLVIGGILLIVSIVMCRKKSPENEGHVVSTQQSAPTTTGSYGVTTANYPSGQGYFPPGPAGSSVGFGTTQSYNYPPGNQAYPLPPMAYQPSNIGPAPYTPSAAMHGFGNASTEPPPPPSYDTVYPDNSKSAVLSAPSGGPS